MDYEALSMLIPKTVQAWSFFQIRKWLNFINMQKLLPLFEKQQLNGNTLMKIDFKKLSQMGISSNIMQKKLMVWIQKGFIEFNEYVQNGLNDKQNNCPNSNKRKTIKQNKSRGMNKYPVIMQSQQANDLKLKITNYQGPQTVYYMANQEGLKIGRSTLNQIQSLQVTVQNEHAQILFEKNQFHIIDLGTKSGTFIKVHYKLELLPQMLIQIGSYLLRVENITSDKQIVLECISLNNSASQCLSIDFKNKQSYSFGRRNTNDFARDDQHMSGTHAKIYFSNGKFILEDMGSTNGTWQRLSGFKKNSQPQKLQDGSIFKIGNTITYICNYESLRKNDNKMQIQGNVHICMQCNQSERNVLFLPCKHTLNCQNCCNQTNFCPLCHQLIQQKVKIFI